MVLAGAKVEHQVEHGFLYFVGTAVGLVHLVNHHNGLQLQLDGLLQDETGLWHGAFKGIDEQQHAVSHVEHTLHLATEVGVAGSVDNVDLHVLVTDGNVFRKNGDAALAFQVVVVKDELTRSFV